MARALRSNKERGVSNSEMQKQPPETLLDGNDASSDLEIYSQEVLNSLMEDNLPPTPNNFSLYFDRLLEKKSDTIRKQILTVLELENSNEDENTIELEHTLKKGFSSVKNILSVTANLYKNISLMTKILDKRKNELDSGNSSPSEAVGVLFSLEADISKLNTILKKQTSQMKTIYDETASIVKRVESETIFDNQYGVYNKRYLLTKIDHEIDLIKQFKHKSSLIFIELSRELKKKINNEKAITLMTRTIARLLLKTSRRSDIVAHYGNGRFSMLLKHTDLESAKKASERLCDLVSNSNFFLADKEIQLRISIGITEIDTRRNVEETVVSAMNGIETAYSLKDVDYAVSLKDNLTTKI
jgi:diguanylate cyclase (GGDEF)-like protein